MTNQQIILNWQSEHASIHDDHPNIWFCWDGEHIAELFEKCPDETEDEMVSAGYIQTPDDELWLMA